jgi:UDP-4-amino-4,6-dideoxy-N-acetyl-beta-L-altrosamine transaminase
MYIPYGRQSIDSADIASVVSSLGDEFLTQGPRVELFEDALKSNFKASFSVAVNSATSALHLACMALDVQKGDLVWTSAITFVASANCARYCDADVDFVDIDPKTYNMSPQELEKKLEIASQRGRLPKVVIPVHLTGQPCDMEAISELSKKFGFSIVEDASHATGADYRQQIIGSSEYSDITVFSFHPVKIITTGEGGAALTNSPYLAKRMRQLRSHGITREASQFSLDAQASFYYEQQELGYNYRMTDFQAALGLSQLSKLSGFLERRREIASIYDRRLADLRVTLPFQSSETKSSWHLYVIRVGDANDPKIRNSIFEKLREEDIGVNLHYIPVYRHPYYSKLGYKTDDYPEAEAYYAQAISIPIHPELTSSQQNYVIDKLSELLT